jgi:hypothetical protein
MTNKDAKKFKTFQRKLSLVSVLGASNLRKVSKVATVLPAILLLLNCFASSAQIERNNIILTNDFEQGSIQPFGLEGCCVTVVSNNFRAGSKALRVALDSSKSSRPERAELKLNTFPDRSERWVGISVYIPSGTSQPYTINQFLRKPGNGKGYAPAFQFTKKSNKFFLNRNLRGTENGDKRGRPEWDLGPAIENQWFDIVYHYKASSSSNGIFEMWINGTKKVDYQGPTADDRGDGPYFKFGVYVGAGNRTDKPISTYFDEVRIGNERATYQDVAPSADLYRVLDTR